MNQTNWTKWSSIAEIISSVAILITLVYLAIQTEQNTSALLANGRQDLLETELEYFRNYIEFPEIAYGDPGIVIPQIDDGLDIDVKIRKVMHAIVLMRMREASWNQFQAGVIDEETWNGYLSALIFLLNNDPYTRAVWIRYKVAFGPGFVLAIDKDERLQ